MEDTIRLTWGDRFSILWLLNQVPGVNKLEATLVQDIRTRLFAQDVEAPPMKPDEVWGDQPLDKSQLTFVKLSLDALWEARKIPAALSKSMLDLDPLLR